MEREKIGVFCENYLDGCGELYASVFSPEPWGGPWAEAFVKIEMQSSGVGGRLLARLEKRLRDSGVGSVFLVTGLHAPARGFYARSGYKDATDMTAIVKSL